MQEKAEPWQLVVTFLVLLGVYFLLPDRMINGVSKGDYEKIVENYEKLEVRYNAYKASGRKSGFIKPEQIDDLREIFIFLHAEDAQEVWIKYHIPASVCMAQAIVESDAGTSALFNTTGNFFGIKCADHSQSSCLGKDFDDCIQYEDDYTYDHFKKCRDASESFAQYVEVLSNPRYKKCFDCGLDYKCWARMLEKAGYATNNQYAEMLISMIERYKLQKLDGDKPYRLTPQQIKRLTGEKEKKNKK
ncbi:MAG: glycoside hydrolase family 73 protein [Candidatus Paceibacterota bacterium]